MAQRLTASERADRQYQRMLQSMRNELKRELERDSKQLLNGLRNELVQELQAAFSQQFQQDAHSASGTAIGSPMGSIGTIARLTTTLLRLSAKPRTSTATYETLRSADAFDQFRTSRGQSLADAAGELNKGERNL